MEKIKTPLGQCIEEFKRLQSKAQKLTDVIYLDGVIAVLESRLPSERDMIEKAWSDGIKFITTDGAPTDKLKKQYFTQTFCTDEK